jgi:prepilin-type N-terminal cleavage/methylation domain-containing protein
MKRRFALGFTLVELLVVIAIIGVLVALLLPAVQAAREAARRSSCTNNLSQLSLAIHQYEMAHGVYPPGTIAAAGPISNTQTGYHHSWTVQILPYIEQQNAYNLLDKRQSVYHPANAAVAANMPRLLMCPSSSARGFPCYAGCHHDKEKPIDAKDNGVFFLNSSIRYDDITDGSSHTIFIGEKLPDAWDLNWLSGTRTTLRNTGAPINWLSFRNGLPRPTTGGGPPTPAMTSLPFLESDEPDDAAQSTSAATPAETTEPSATTPPETTAPPAEPPADPTAPPADPADAAAGGELPGVPAAPPVFPTGRKLAVLPGNPAFVGGFGGEHPGGAIFALGDGSIRFMSNNTTGKLLQRFAHRADGQLPSNDF